MTKEFIQKFANVQKQVNVGKNGYNGFGKYNYRTIDDMLGTIKPLLAEAGMVMYFTDDIIPMGKKMSLMTVSKEAKWDSTKKMLVTTSQNQELKEVDRIILKTTITVTDGENQLTNSAYADIDTTASMSDEQKVGAASTYARKYALNGMFAIDDGKLDPDKLDPDANITNNNDEKSKKDMDDVSKNLDTKSEKSKSNNGKKEIKENDFVDKEVINKVIKSFNEIGIDENTLFQNLKLKKEQIKQKDLDILREYFNQKKSEYEKEKVS